MAINFFNMVLEPFYIAFGTFSPDTNLMQFALLVLCIVGSIRLLFSLLKYKYF